MYIMYCALLGFLITASLSAAEYLCFREAFNLFDFKSTAKFKQETKKSQMEHNFNNSLLKIIRSI